MQVNTSALTHLWKCMLCVKAQYKKDDPKTNTLHWWCMFLSQIVWSSADMLGICLYDTGYHYLFTLDLVSVLWLQEASANWCEQKWRFWLLVKSRQKALQWLIRWTDWNRALCYETYFIWNAFSLGIWGNELQTQRLRMRPLYLTVVAESYFYTK